MSNSKPVVMKVRNLQVHHAGRFNLQLHRGETLFIRGQSGSGKSLLLRAIADIDPALGEVLLNATERGNIPAPQWRRQVMLVPAAPQWWHETISEHFPENRDEHLPGWLKQLKLRENILEEPAERLSSGESQRLALLRALLWNPQVLLLDEPTANLDPSTQQRVEQFVLDYQQQHGTGIIWVSHDKEQTARLAHHCLTLENGALEHCNDKA